LLYAKHNLGDEENWEITSIAQFSSDSNSRRASVMITGSIVGFSGSYLCTMNGTHQWNISVSGILSRFKCDEIDDLDDSDRSYDIEMNIGWRYAFRLLTGVPSETWSLSIYVTKPDGETSILNETDCETSEVDGCIDADSTREGGCPLPNAEADDSDSNTTTIIIIVVVVIVILAVVIIVIIVIVKKKKGNDARIEDGESGKEKKDDKKKSSKSSDSSESSESNKKGKERNAADEQEYAFRDIPENLNEAAVPQPAGEACDLGGADQEQGNEAVVQQPAGEAYDLGSADREHGNEAVVQQPEQYPAAPEYTEHANEEFRPKTSGE
jgi:flagellar basal body-associated protein FliL